MTREEVLRHPAYWFEYEQNELFRQVSDYMERENINQTELAKRLDVGKSYVSQILNGNFNYTLKKLIELCLAIGLVPKINYNTIEDVIKEDVKLKEHYDNLPTSNYMTASITTIPGSGKLSSYDLPNSIEEDRGITKSAIEARVIEFTLYAKDSLPQALQAS